jgi:hypothetical protein
VKEKFTTRHRKAQEYLRRLAFESHRAVRQRGKTRCRAIFATLTPDPSLSTCPSIDAVGFFRR